MPVPTLAHLCCLLLRLVWEVPLAPCEAGYNGVIGVPKLSPSGSPFVLLAALAFVTVTGSYPALSPLSITCPWPQPVPELSFVIPVREEP